MPRKANGNLTASKKLQTPSDTPSREKIALRAYQIYLERGGSPGHELEDWTQAEQELMVKNGKAKRKTPTKPIAA